MANKIDYKQKFIRFLKAKNAYGAFMYNINDSKTRQRSIPYIFKFNSPDLFLLQGFDWGRGAGSINYWHQLHKQWCEVVKNLNLTFNESS